MDWMSIIVSRDGWDIMLKWKILKKNEVSCHYIIHTQANVGGEGKQNNGHMLWMKIRHNLEKRQLKTQPWGAGANTQNSVELQRKMYWFESQADLQQAKSSDTGLLPPCGTYRPYIVTMTASYDLLGRWWAVRDILKEYQLPSLITCVRAVQWGFNEETDAKSSL